jgi:uncharacterized protein YndB with AHSA1/START domain
VRVAASPETVFAYFTDPTKMVQWMGAEATLDPRPGGICRIVFKPTQSVIEFLRATFDAEEEQASEVLPPDGVSVMSGEFVVVDPYSRIELTWGWELELLAVPPQSTAVEISFTPSGNETIVRVAHRRLPAESATFHRVGWEHHLSRLAAAASGGDPGPDPWQRSSGQAS